jgi:hypothetical protein
MESTWLKVSNSITLPDGRVMQKTKVREEDYIPESAGLLTARVENPLMKREQFATDQRKSRKKDLIASKRELFSCKTPVERSVSPMFGGSEGLSRIPGQVAEEEKVGMDTPPEKGTLETDVPKTDTRETDVPEKYSRVHHETRVGETRVSNSHGSYISVEAKNSNSPINK